jgi:arabinan endo-1,5-alpha-L-arabinosidase
MIKKMKIYKSLPLIVLGLMNIVGCGKDPMPIIINPPIDTTKLVDVTTLDDGPVDFSFFQDQYSQLSSPSLTKQWAHYNTHDPAYLDDGKFVYSYSTDVAFGSSIKAGAQIRRSINLVEWEFVGWVFPSLPLQASNFIRSNGGVPNEGVWAPCPIKVGAEYRVYYSLASNVGRLSAIGLAVGETAKGPFFEKGLVVTSLNNGTRQTNAIDPTVIADKAGNHWMFYGSAWDGIYKLELNPTTGLAIRTDDKGIRVAQRGNTNSKANGNIEGPDILYNDELDMYYLFIAYDWLGTKYNVRVGRSKTVNGPFLDKNGKNINDEVDDVPMILASYKFENHPGWQGVSHCGTFKKNGKYYIGHQGRPASNAFYMIMHTRQLFWTEDGWPLVSSQRYATEIETPVLKADLVGNWEWIDFSYTIVPGYEVEQKSPDFSTSIRLTLDTEGTINKDAKQTWTYEAPWLTLKREGKVYKLHVERGRDWENNVESTILMTGLNEGSLPTWGKKVK